MATVAENAGKVLAFLYKAPSNEHYDGSAVQGGTELEPSQINDAVAILVENGYAEWLRFLGTAPFKFGNVWITPRGRFEYERAQAANQPQAAPAEQVAAIPRIVPPPTPIGSPYGFQDEDWELVSERKGSVDRLNVVLGYQFTSEYYDSDLLQANLQRTFEIAIQAYNKLQGAIPATLNFRALSAGYGEHLFNEIARDIISADIAVFDTSDLNPNMMLEVGVALTWGVRVLVIKIRIVPDLRRTYPARRGPTTATAQHIL
jgi:hypothetical protein